MLNPCFGPVRLFLAFDLYIDASNLATGGDLKHLGQPIAYYSKKLKSAEEKYSTYVKDI